MKDVLIVDDEAYVVRLLRIALERAGYGVRQASNGAQAFDEIRRQQPDFLITDIDMPFMSGRELCERIAAEMPTRDFGICALTSRPEQRSSIDTTQGLRLMEKPVSVRQLLTDLDEYFQTSGRGEEAWTATR